MKSNTRKKSEKPCKVEKECASGKCVNGKCLKPPGETCDSSAECASGKCIIDTTCNPPVNCQPKCLADFSSKSQNKNRFLLKSTYSEPKSTSPELLEKIRSTIRVEPDNTGLKHPTNIYIPIGHGGENTQDKHIVPKGCILVVKSHSGDLRFADDLEINLKSILNNENKETVFDPVSHKKELFSVITSDMQHNKKDVSATSSTAIYREGDTYNNFIYTPVSKFITFFTVSGIYNLKYTDDLNKKKILYFKEDPITYNYYALVMTPVRLNLSKEYIYNSFVLKIPSFFKYSDTYKYYYTEQHIKDILDIILKYVNFEQTSDNTSIENLVRSDIYVKIKKGYKLGDENHLISIIKKYFKYTGIDDTEYASRLVKMNIITLLTIISDMTIITQSELFNDVESGLIENPGIFYNLVCRATTHTNEVTTLLNETHLGSLRTPISVHSQVNEEKNRIEESILHGRKNQARQVFNSKANGYSNKTLKNNFNKLREEKNNNSKRPRNCPEEFNATLKYYYTAKCQS